MTLAQIGTLEAKVAKLEKLLPILRERTRMHDALYNTRHGSRIQLLDERQKLIELEGDVHLGSSEIAEADASLAALRAQKSRAIAEYARERRAELVAVRGRMIALLQDIRQAREQRARHILVSPVAGVVQDLAVHTQDGVVEPGTQIMVIVPRDTGLRVEAFVSNDDVGFVRPGQRATLKIATFDFRRYGTIEGTVTNVARDAVTVYNVMRQEHPDQLRVLTEPFHMALQFPHPDHGQRWTRLPFLSVRDDVFNACAYRVHIKRAQALPGVPGLTQAQSNALDAFNSVAERVSVSIELRPGDMEFFNNHVVLHTRTQFTDDRPGRHLLRVWLSMAGFRTLHEQHPISLRSRIR